MCQYILVASTLLAHIRILPNTRKPITIIRQNVVYSTTVSVSICELWACIWGEEVVHHLINLAQNWCGHRNRALSVSIPIIESDGRHTHEYIWHGMAKQRRKAFTAAMKNEDSTFIIPHRRSSSVRFYTGIESIRYSSKRATYDFIQSKIEIPIERHPRPCIITWNYTYATAAHCKYILGTTFRTIRTQ